MTRLLPVGTRGERGDEAGQDVRRVFRNGDPEPAPSTVEVDGEVEKGTALLFSLGEIKDLQEGFGVVLEPKAYDSPVDLDLVDQCVGGLPFVDPGRGVARAEGASDRDSHNPMMPHATLIGATVRSIAT